MPDETPTPLLLDGPAVAATLGVSLATFHAMRAAGQFPLTPLRSRRCVRWRAADVTAWVGAGCPGDAKWRAMTATPRTDMRRTA